MARPTITFDDWLNKDGDQKEKINWLKSFYEGGGLKVEVQQRLLVESLLGRIPRLAS